MLNHSNLTQSQQTASNYVRDFIINVPEELWYKVKWCWFAFILLHKQVKVVASVLEYVLYGTVLLYDRIDKMQCYHLMW